MWSLLRQNQEPLLAGTAVALAILAVFGQSGQDRFLGDQSAAQSVTCTAATHEMSAVSSVPRDHEYYRAKWRQIATEFYAAHPVGREVATATTPAAVVTASLSDQTAPTEVDCSVGQKQASSKKTDGQGTDALVTPPQSSQPIELESRVTHASHVTASKLESVLLATPPSPTLNAHSPSTRSRQWTVVCAIVAGLLTCGLFRIMWPGHLSQDMGSARTILENAHALRIELPAEWVTVRPTIRQRSKPLVLAACYVASSIAAWSIYF